MTKAHKNAIPFLVLIVSFLSGCGTLPLKEISEEAYTNKIVFKSERNGNEGIYVMDINGDNVKQLTTGDEYAVLPSWSPDGQKIAFLSVREEDYEKYPDGFPAFHWLLYVMNADGTNQKILNENPMAMFFWSPDGKKILFDSSYEDPENYKGVRDGTVSSAVYVMDADGKNQKRLTPIEGHDSFPFWSMDGKQIIFASMGKGAYSMNPDGSNKQKLPDDSIYNKTFFPPETDGNVIVFVDDYVENLDIYIMDANGENKRNLTNSDARDLDPMLSPDGKKILFRSFVDDDWDIYTMNIDGSELTNITNNPGFDGESSWSPIIRN